MRKLDAYRLYLFMGAWMALFFDMIFVASAVYQITVAHLSPLQLVLVGTALEAAVFLFEAPTGVVADMYSRRLSIIIGMFLIGIGFLIEGSFPSFLPILLAQVLWGVGYTFTSGATEAWLTDEIGEEAAGRAFLRSTQLSLLFSLIGLGLGVWLGAQRVNLPIQVGGVMLLLLAPIEILWMPETGFKPAPREQRSSWQQMARVFQEGLRLIRGRPTLLAVMAAGLIYGLYSEGFDRLWTKHLLEQFTLPFAGQLQPVVIIGVIRAVGMLISVGAAELARRKLRTDAYEPLANALWGMTALLAAGMFGFALAGSLAAALVAYWLIAVSRNVIGPLYMAWVNQRLDSSVRATVLSMSSQVDAIGQIAGGPGIGLVGSLVSVRAALLASATVLSPILLIFPHAIRLNRQQSLGAEISAEDELTV